MIETILKWFLCGLFTLTSLLWLSSYTHHTGVGIDHDFDQENRVLHVFSRLSWTGHGSIWLGYGSTVKTKPESTPLEKFDLAAVFFKPNTKSLSPTASTWNRLGFWFIQAKQPKPSLWVGIPSVLPVFFSGLLLLVWYRRTSSSH